MAPTLNLASSYGLLGKQVNLSVSAELFLDFLP